jgi:enamine deaminase RidA (YjgF/YER057c/UK114 family)
LARQHITSGAKWESIVGYSRAVRDGAFVAVSGTVGALPDGAVPDGGYAQAARAFEIAVAALDEAGASKHDVIRTRMYVTDIERWEEFGRAHAEVFGDVRPATTMVEVSRLIDPRMLIEVEVDAIIGG